MMPITRKGFLKSLVGTVIGGSLCGRAAEALTVAQEESNGKHRPTRIADIQVWPFAMQQKQTVRTALGILSAENVLLRLRTNDGVVGWGESSPYSPIMSETQATDTILAKPFAEIVRGCDPFCIPKVVAEMDAFAPGNPGIKAAFEIALWDICGKIAGQPVCRLLGHYRDSFLTDLTVFIDAPAVMADNAKTVVRQGFKAVKIKLGGVPEADIERLRAVREAVGENIALRIDANQGWTPTDAVRALKGLEKYQVEFCEQPVAYWDWEGMKFVRQHSPIPVMADEGVHTPHDAIEAVRHEACDMINIKLMKSGGLLSAMRIAAIAGAANMKCMLGCMSETRVALTAAAHVVSSSPNVMYADLDAFTNHHIDPIIGGMEVNDGTIRLPEKPGLGLDVDPAFLKTLREGLR